MLRTANPALTILPIDSAKQNFKWLTKEKQMENLLQI